MDWHLHPDAILMAALLLGLYAAGARWVGARCSPPRQLTRGQAACYVSGVLALYIGAGSPIHDISENYLLSMHMLQHLLFSLVAPPLLLLGTPGWMLRPLVENPIVRRAGYEATRPFAALVIFNLIILVSHLPSVVDLTLRYHTVHFFAHVVLVTGALIMWMPVLSPVAEWPRVGPFAQIVYLFVQQLVPAVIASFLVFANHPLYEFYAWAPPYRMWGLSVLDDQRWAAVVMKLLGGTLLWAVMAVIFFRWFGQEDRETAARSRQVVNWPEVEAELGRMGLTKR
jgi:putative membrane protein